MKGKGITAGALKWIAVITMLIDHYGLTIYVHTTDWVYEYYRIMRYIGRISFPIYCFLLIEGFYHTKNVKRYVLRCLMFGLVSEIPFDLATHGSVFYLQSQNIYFTLTTGLCMIWCLERIKGAYLVPKRWAGIVPVEYFQWGASFLCIAIGAGAAQLLEMDYHYMGILLIAALYYCREFTPLVRSLVGAVAFAFEKTAPLAFIPIYFYNGQRGKQNKYFFYMVYPIHLLIFGLIQKFFL
ncbi:MAG: conjugal transfer protein TraX [Lachnospiraceae bacterium]|nr:conjugal transfer protein TraX [Lachnospiraceae bacterium]